MTRKKRKLDKSLVVNEKKKKDNLISIIKVKDDTEDKVKEYEIIDNQIEDIYNEFYGNLNSLGEFFTLTQNNIIEKIKDCNDIEKKYIKDNKSKENNEKIFLEMTNKDAKNFDKNYKLRKVFTEGNNIFIKSIIIYYHTLLENLLHKLFFLIYNNKPNCLEEMKIDFNFTELSKFENIDDIKNETINKKINSIFRGSVDEQINELLSLLGAKDNSGEFPISELVSFSQIRNIIVHNDGIINDQYLNKCKEFNFKHKYNKGDIVNLESDYFDNLHDTYYIFLVKVIFYVYTNLSKKDDKYNNIIGEFLNDKIVLLINNKKYNLGTNLINFIIDDTKNFKRLNDIVQTVLLINKALILKKENKKDDVNSLINNMDWSSKKSRFILAKHILLEDWDKAGKVLSVVLIKDFNPDNEMHLDNYIGKYHLQKWPLFYEFIETDIFKDIYYKTFGENFSYGYYK